MKIVKCSVLAAALGLSALNAGAEPAETALSLMSLAGIHRDRGDHRQAVLLYRRSGEMTEKSLGSQDPFLLAVFYGLASTYEEMRDYDAAEAVYAEIRLRGYPEWAEQMELRADIMRNA